MAFMYVCTLLGMHTYMHMFHVRLISTWKSRYLSDDACIYDIDHVMQNIPQNNESIEMIE
jgi:hypothetical protein